MVPLAIVKGRAVERPNPPMIGMFLLYLCVLVWCSCLGPIYFMLK